MTSFNGKQAYMCGMGFSRGDATQSFLVRSFSVVCVSYSLLWSTGENEMHTLLSRSQEIVRDLSV